MHGVCVCVCARRVHMDMACGDATPTLLILSTLVAQHRRGHHSTYYGYIRTMAILTTALLALHRIYEAIAAGCIPVIIADRLQLPFARRLAWPSFSVRIAEAEALADPLAIVRTVSPPSPPTPSPPTPSPPLTLARAASLRSVWPLHRQH